MDKAKKIEADVWRLSDALRSVMYIRNIPYMVTRLVFLKYVIDNYIGAFTMEEMQQYAKVQKMLAMRDVENGLESIIPVLEYVDRAYGLDRIISSNGSIAEYELALFGVDRTSKKNVTTHSFRYVMEALAEMDLAEEEEEIKVGELLVDFLIAQIMNDSNKSIARTEITTSIQLADIAKGLLSVKSEDTFCDFVSGIGISTIRINEGAMPKIISSDIDIDVTSLSAMLYMMRGFKNFAVYCGDNLRDLNPDIRGNRIFVDPPLAVRIKDGNPEEYSDAALRVIDRILKYHLEDNGIAVVAVPSGVLFGSGPSRKLKKDILEKGYLRAVISLPPMWYGTVIGTNLIVISKEARENVLFMDAFSDRKASKRKSAILSENEIMRIIDVFNGNVEEKGFSKVISKAEIVEKGYTIIPKAYVEITNKEEIASVKEIDTELERLYASLKG